MNTLIIVIQAFSHLPLQYDCVVSFHFWSFQAFPILTVFLNLGLLLIRALQCLVGVSLSEPHTLVTVSVGVSLSEPHTLVTVSVGVSLSEPHTPVIVSIAVLAQVICRLTEGRPTICVNT